MSAVLQSKSKENDCNEEDLRVSGREFLESGEDQGDFKEGFACGVGYLLYKFIYEKSR